MNQQYGGALATNKVIRALTTSGIWNGEGMAKTQVLIVDDHPLALASIESLLRMEKDIEIVGMAMSGEQAIATAKELRPDLVIMDFRMDGMDGVEAGRIIRVENPGIDVVILSTFDEFGHTERVRAAGIAGWLSKDDAPDELLEAIISMIAARSGRQTII